MKSNRALLGVGRSAAVWVMLAALRSICTAQPATAPRTNFWSPDGFVSHMIEAGDRLYVSGQFSNLVSGYYHGAIYDLASGIQVGQLPELAGRLAIVLPDGKDGWFIGGGFSSISGTTRSNLAHLNRDGSLDTAWQCNTDGAVLSLAIHENTLFVGGNFRSIAGQIRTNLAAVRIANGEPLIWKRSAATLGSVWRMLLSDRKVLVQEIGGTPFRHLAAYDLQTGELSAWLPHINDRGYVALGCSGDAVFVGGAFRAADGKRRLGLAAWDLRTDQLLPWKADAEFDLHRDPGEHEHTAVNQLWANEHLVLAAGYFNYLAGKPRKNFGALNPKTGKLLDWTPEFESAPDMGEFANGKFYCVAGPSLYEVDFDARRTRRAIERLPAGARSLAVSGDRACVVGWFPKADAVRCPGLAAVDLRTGCPADWHPDTTSVTPHSDDPPRRAIIAGNSLLGVWLQPTQPHGTTMRIAAFDLRVGGAPIWMTDVEGNDCDLTALGKRVLVRVSPRRGNANLKLLDPNDGKLAEWGPTFAQSQEEASLSGFAVAANRIYFHGNFDRVGGLSCTNLAVLDTTTGEVLPWYPQVEGRVTRILAHAGKIYVSGGFRRIDGAERPGLAAFDAATGLLSVWVPRVQVEELYYPQVKEINGLAAHDNKLFVAIGGRLDVGIPGQRIFAFAETDGTRLAWGQEIAPVRAGGSFRPYTIVQTGASGVYVAGDFPMAGGVSVHGFAAFPWHNP